MVWCFMVWVLAFLRYWVWGSRRFGYVGKTFGVQGLSPIIPHMGCGLSGRKLLCPLCKALMGSAESTNHDISLTLRVVELPLGL